MSNPIVETDCTITHDGIPFTSGGSVVTDDNLIAYIGKGNAVTTWHGVKIGTYRTVSTRRINSYLSSHMSQVTITLADGRIYKGRTLGQGMIVKAKRSSSKA